MKIEHSEPAADAEKRGRRGVFRRRAAAVASAALCVGVWLCYWRQPDWLAPVTLVPAGFWLVPGLALAALGYNAFPRRWSVAAVALWVAYAVVMVEESHSLARSVVRPAAADWNAARNGGRALRVVSLNCGTGNPRVIEDLAGWQPDIVLLQESPGREQLDQIARQLFGAEGGVLWSSDASIIAGGQVRPRSVRRGLHFVQAEVELPTGLRAEVISLRLSPPVFRLDFWKRGFWSDHHDNRVRHRRQIQAIMRRIASVAPSTPLIVGGDFNAPPRDGALVPMRKRLRDTFRRAGRGWGNTGTNSLPLFRVDQVWASPHFRAMAVSSRKTLHSDHRLVVCELVLGSP